MGKLKIQQFRTNDLIDDNGKQIEFGKLWTESFFNVDSSVDEVVLNLIFKSISPNTISLDGKNVALKLAGVTGRSDRKAYANGNNGRSQLKDFFLSDLGLSLKENISDFFALYQVNSNEYYLYYIPELLYHNFINFFENSNTEVSILRNAYNRIDTNETGFPLQTIYYGAPGTGKSNTIKREVEDAGKIHFRTTFHPDSDYSTFVGCYKPTKNVRHNLMSYVELIEKCKEYAKRAGYNNQNLTQFGFDYYDSLTEVLKDKTLSYASLLVSANVTDTSASSYVTAGVDLHTKIADKIAPITYDFVPQAFVKAYCDAWNNYTEEKIEDVYLIIEEINRGNCAQIFGDLFQLLDRKNNGFSTYPIDADEDLKKFLLNGTKEDGTPWLVNKDGIKDGKLCLPANLHIWATMNTSDQSLFPIDSAFKRRWDWEYVPIKRADKEPENKWIIKVTHDGKTYWCYWWEFLEAINHQIEETTHSEDKQLGYFFCKANESGVIDAKIFVNKVIFYLWNDVFKDEDSKVFQYGEKDDDVANITRSGNIYFRHFVDNTDEMVHYFINQLFAMGKESTLVVPIDYLKNDANSKVIEHLPKMREDCEETPMPKKGNNDEIKEEEGGEIGKVVYTYPEYEQIFDRVDAELQAVGCKRIGNTGNSIDYKLKDIPNYIGCVSARLNKTKNDAYGEVLLWINTNKTEPVKSKKIRDKIASQTEGVFKTFESGNVTLRTLEKDPTSIKSIFRGWVLKNPDIKFTDESLDNDAKWIYETMKRLLDQLQPIIEGALKWNS